MKLAVIADYDPESEPHVCTDAAIAHSAEALELDVRHEWVATTDAAISRLREFDALWFGPGSPYQNFRRTLDAIRYARENSVPALGTCGGFQHLVIEYARHVAGIEDAQHAEYDPYASRLIVSRLDCSLVGQQMEIRLQDGSVAQQSYGAAGTTERYYCNFGINPDFLPEITAAGLKVSGVDADGECRVMELGPTHHPFYVGTLFVPQSASRADQPHPLVNAFLKAGAARGRGI